MGDSLMVERSPLERKIMVRVHISQPENLLEK